MPQHELILLQEPVNQHKSDVQAVEREMLSFRSTTMSKRELLGSKSEKVRARGCGVDEGMMW